MRSKKKFKNFWNISFILIFLFSQINFIWAKAETINSANGQASPNVIERQSDQEFTINFNLQPERIRKKDITINNGAYKEIVLVIDTSGSMGDTLDRSQKLSTLKNIACDFIDKFSGDSKAYIAAVEYNHSAKVLGEGLVNSSKFKELKNNINSLKAEGSTNIGDGLRKAYYLLDKGREDAEKHIILLTDGAPTAYTGKTGTVKYKQSWLYTQGFITDSKGSTEFSSITSKQYETSDASIGTYVSYYGDSSQKDAMNYIEAIGNLIKAKQSIHSYVIGLGYGINSPELAEIAKHIDGKKVKANNKNQINKIYEEIAETISSTTSTEANFYLKVPAGIEVTNLPPGLEYKNGAIGGVVKIINYVLEYDGNNGGGNDYYKADSISFSLSFKGKVTNSALYQQAYKVVGTDTYLTYVVSDREYKHNFNDVSIKINNKLTLKAPIKVSQALAQGVEKDKLKVEDSFNINYVIDPSEGIEKLKHDSQYKRDKEIVLVIDTSGSMSEAVEGNEVGYKWVITKIYYNGKWNEVSFYDEETNKIKFDNKLYTIQQYKDNWKNEVKIDNKWYGVLWEQKIEKDRLSIVKEAAINFFNNFKEDSKTKIAVVSYSSYGKIIKSLTEANRTTELINIVNSLKASGGTNIGDGIRKAYEILDNNSDSDKYIIMMTDGFPTAFTSYKDSLKTTSKGDNQGIIVENGYEIGYFSQINAYSYKLTNDNKAEQYVVNYGNSDYDNLAINYSLKAAEHANNLNHKLFFIGFSDGINSDKLKLIADRAAGYYKEANDEGALSQLYESIADEISLPTVKDIKFQMRLPEGLIAEEIKYINLQTPMENLYIEEGGRVIVGSLENINYNSIQKINNIDYYTIDTSILEKLKFTVKIKATKPGDYLIGTDEHSAIISYTDTDGSSSSQKFSPEISLKVIDEKAPISITKFGMFISKVEPEKQGDIENYIKAGEAGVLSGFNYTLGSVLEIGAVKPQDIGKPLGEELTLDIKTTGIDCRGNTTIMLYTIVNGKLTLIETFKNVSNGQITISGDKINMGQKYIITQNFIPYIMDTTEEPVNAYNNITINSVINTINSIKLINNLELPDLD